MTSNWVQACLALTALLGAVSAQRRPAEGQSTSAAQRAFDEKLEALVARFQQEQQEVYQAYSRAKTDEEREKILQGLPGPEFVPEFRALAEEAPGTETAARAWIWVLRLVQDKDPEEARRTLQRLLQDHLGSAALDELAGELRYTDHIHGEARVIEALWAMIEGSPHQRVQAASLYTLGSLLVESADVAKKQQGRELFERLISEYRELVFRGDETYGQVAEGYLFELDRLQLGMVAPDFEAVDENGASWKLSDYRGKVVVVDFWGFW